MFLFSKVLAAFYLSANSVSAWTGGKELLIKKRAGVNKGREGEENWGKRTFFMDDPQVENGSKSDGVRERYERKAEDMKDGTCKQETDENEEEIKVQL